MAISEQPTFTDLDLLTEASDLLTLRELDKVLPRILDLAAKAVDAQDATLLLYDDGGTQWSYYYSGESLTPEQSQRMMQIILEKGLGGWVAQHGQGAIVTDTDNDDRWFHFPEQRQKMRSALSVPMIYHDQMMGVLTLAHSEREHFSTYHLRLMTILANQAAIAVRNARSYDRIQAQRQQLEAVLRAVPDTLLVMNEEGQILVTSDALFSILTELDQDKIVGMSINDLTEIDAVFAPLSNLVETQAQSMMPTNVVNTTLGNWSFECTSERVERDYLVNVSRWQHQPMSVDPTPHAAVGGYVVVMRDITVLRKLGRFKDEMLRLVSHDLRTPLVLIIGYADLLATDVPRDQPELRQFIDGITAAAERMDTMLTEMLRLEKIKTTPLELHEELDLQEIILQVMRDITPLAEQKQITLKLNTPRGMMPPVIGDRILVRQAMDNLANNAVKYTPNGGEVTLEANVDQRTQRFNFIVKDNGVGIPYDDLPYIFESFFRANMASNKPIKGAGLGLSLVKNVIQQHGGSVWVESELDKGSTFGFWLPLKPTDAV